MSSSFETNPGTLFGDTWRNASHAFRSGQAASKGQTRQASAESEPQAGPQQFSNRGSSFTLFACALFAVLGIVTTLLGPILPFLGLRWSISSAQAGTLFSWQFISSTLGTLLSGMVLSRRSFRVPVVAGVGLCLLGVAVLLRADWTTGRMAVAVYGLGLGIALPAINLAVAQANPSRRAASVSLLNFAWGIGAIGGPVLLRTLHDLNRFLLVTSALLLLG